MADSTIDAISPPTSAWFGGISRTIRRVKPTWLAVVAVLGFLALCVVAADAGADELRAARSQQVERVVALDSALRTQQYLDARAAIQIEDLHAQAAAQLDALASSAGFLK
ncbi:hypothetical protein GCM10009775_13380 [Microbacterium aoyamense]|uniref:Methyl-accepting chemotaxis protein n=1 Tax=Microbacterium aoyamense TaxID=344166 RepID=A0ABN2PHQ9_9MICO|nr:hypothetical protein [Microbacterium aoyamense]